MAVAKKAAAKKVPAKKAAEKSPEAAETESPAPEAVSDKSKPKSEPDRVAMVSMRADGTPDQTDDYEVIGQD